jgi:hypothetical protein
MFLAPKAPRRHPERDRQKAIVTYLRLRGCVVAVTDAGAVRRATRGRQHLSGIPDGWPDITGVMPGGQFIGVEVKAPGGRQSLAQKIVQALIVETGGLYVLAFSIDDLEPYFTPRKG